MKSYTDIEQSKKLAEFLPLENADMDYIPFTNIPEEYNCVINEWDNEHVIEEGWIPCWSLAAMLSILPNSEHISTTITRGGWKIEPIEYMPNTWWCEYEDSESPTYFNTSADNPVDACYKMIIKLKELNLL